MVKKFVLIILCLNLFKSNADAPGKRAMSESKVTLKNISKLKDYTFYWKGEFDSVEGFNNDITFTIPGSGGRPMSAIVWGINKKNNISTDTIFFSNFYAPDFIITFDTISNNKLLYSKDQVSNGNDGGYYGDNDFSNGEETNHSTKIILFSSISLIALILLIWFFIRRKNTLNP